MVELKPHLSFLRQGLDVVPDEVWLRTDLQTLVCADLAKAGEKDFCGSVSGLIPVLTLASKVRSQATPRAGSTIRP
jgi:hypothetical protein